jgi:hypothetical protein
MCEDSRNRVFWFFFFGMKLSLSKNHALLQALKASVVRYCLSDRCQRRLTMNTEFDIGWWRSKKAIQ